MFDIGYNQRPGENRDFQSRLFFLIIITIIIFIILIITIGNIQIIQYISYAKQSKDNREKVIRVLPIRGRIYSSDDKLLAYDKMAFNIYINPNELYEDNILRQNELLFLCDALKLNYVYVEEKLKSKNYSEEVLIKENIDLIAYAKVKENMDNLPGIIIMESLYREYPYKDVLSHVLGYTGPISPDELALKQKYGYIQLDHIGKNGVERFYEDILRGRPGEKVFLVDARMIIQNEIKEKEKKPVPGYELVLTINLDFQKNVEDILADRVGSILVVKPATGEILAMASYPDYDPNIYILQSDENNKKRREISLDTKYTPLINRNIQAVYPPGSVFKLVTTTAILNENILSTYDKFYCGGVYRYGRENFKCWVYPSGHGWQTLIDGIANSCDVFFYNAGLKVGPERIHQYALYYGFGNYLEVDLPYEKEGFIPSIQWMKNKGEIWLPGNTLNTVIGQGDVAATPLQIVNYMSVLCNKGYSYKPHILKKVLSPSEGSIESEIKSEKIIDLTHIDKSAFDFIQNALRKVVSNGTAGLAFSTNPLKIAGKTGTAEVEKSKEFNMHATHSWFAGFGPVDYPLEDQIAVVVLIEYENNNYLRYAAPIASMVFNSWFNNENFIDTARRMRYPVKSSYKFIERSGQQ